MLEVSISDHGFNESVISLTERITSREHTTLLWRMYLSKQAEESRYMQRHPILGWRGVDLSQHITGATSAAFLQ